MSSIDIIGADGMRLPAGSKAPKGARYRARWRTPTGASRVRTFDRKIDAEQFLISQEHSKASGTYVDRSAGEATVAAYAASWIATRRTRSGQPLGERTKALYEQLVRTHIGPNIGSVRLRDLRPEQVRAWRSRLEGSTAPAKAYRLLRAIMTTAVDDELIGRNPCKVDNGGVERAPERPVPTRDEVWALADAIDRRYRVLVLVAAFVGLRWSELAALRREDVDLDERTISVRREARKSDASYRTVAVPPVLLPELRVHLEEYVDGDPLACVFTGPKGAVPERSNFHSIWKKARTTVGRDDLHLHDLRHFGATVAAQAGATTKELMTRLGHSSPDAALRYQHATAERDQLLAARMDALMVAKNDAAESMLRLVEGG